jgi:hypothetical protein
MQESCSYYFCSILFNFRGLTPEIEAVEARKYWVGISNIRQGMHCLGARFVLRKPYFEPSSDKLHNFSAPSDEISSSEWSNY